jgi:hypothetical protein
MYREDLKKYSFVVRETILPVIPIGFCSLLYCGALLCCAWTAHT